MEARTRDCTIEEARQRLQMSRAFSQAADLVANNFDDEEYRNVAGSLYVLAAIAAADAACGAALRKWSRSQDHQDAEKLLGKLDDGERVAQTLRRILVFKDEAHYGWIHLSSDAQKTMSRNSQQLQEFAERQFA